jgi:hypothetical protein
MFHCFWLYYSRCLPGNFPTPINNINRFVLQGSGGVVVEDIFGFHYIFHYKNVIVIE